MARSSGGRTLELVLTYILLAVVLISTLVEAAPPPSIGVNYGRVANNLPPPKEAVALMRRMGVGSVRIFDADHEVLSALANTGMRVAMTVKNQDIPALAASQPAADAWVQSNVNPFFPATRISILEVGNEILSDLNNKGLWTQLVPAMRNLQTSLSKFNLAGSIKITTSFAMDVLGSSFPPSAGAFRTDISTSIMQPLLQFLSQNRAPFFLNVYPYLTWVQNSQQIPLQYALFNGQGSPVMDGKFIYTNLLDSQLDAVWAAMAKLGVPKIQIVISETGWPTLGDPNQPNASPQLAAVYNQRLVNHMLAAPPKGTPAHPGAIIPTFIFGLFNENLKPGPMTERNWGILDSDGQPVYHLNLFVPGSAGAAPPENDNKPSPAPTPSSNRWCVAKPTADPATLQHSLDFACGSSAAFCSPLQPGKPCEQPNTLIAHASYAFNQFWHANNAKGATCDFNGVAMITATDPSHDGCVFVPTSQGSAPPPASTDKWCVARADATPAALQSALDFACAANAAFCSPVQPGQPCAEPNTLVAHASFAFNAFWQANKAQGATCDFKGVATFTTINPSHDECVFSPSS